MRQRRGDVWFAGAMTAGLLLATGGPAAAREGAFTPVLLGNGPSFCGPCEPGPVVTRAAPDSAVVALRYRWSAEARGFELVSKEEVGVTDRQGELRFRLEQGKASLDKVEVWVDGALSDGFLFLTNGGCSGPLLCPLPRRVHALVNASAFLPGQGVTVTVAGAEPGGVLEVAPEEYVEDGDAAHWVPAGDPIQVDVDAHGHATAVLEAAGPGVYRAIAYDRETGEESSFALFEVSDSPR